MPQTDQVPLSAATSTMGPRPSCSALPRGRTRATRWSMALARCLVTDRGFDVMETPSFFRAETGDNRLEMVRGEFG